MNIKPKRLILGFIPNNQCNLKCRYCYITQLNKWGKSNEEFNYSPSHIVKALSRKRLGGISIINLTGQGETLLYSGIEELVYGLLAEGHFVELVTNAISTKIINNILSFPDLYLERLEFKVSFHYIELKNKNLLAKFFNNINVIKNSSASFSLELMPHDEIENEIENINALCMSKLGAKCHATIGRKDNYIGRGLLTNHTKERYSEIWSHLESEMFKYKMDLIDVKRREFCYAGSWTLYVDLSTGEARPCYGQPVNQNIFNNLNKPILFRPVGHYCVQPYCINGHAFLTLGAIPSLEAPTYEQIRNRKCIDGSEWLSAPCKSCFSAKLCESNKEYSSLQKILHTIFYPFDIIYYMAKNWSKTTELIKVQMKRYRQKRIHL